MRRVMVSLATASILAGFASAQTIDAPEGDWVWNAELNINGLTLTKSGNTCLTSETSQLDLSEIVSNLNETCSVSDWNEDEEIAYFAVNCTGEYLANMTGEIALGEADASFTLAGAVRLGDAGPVTTVINGKAANNGVCAVSNQPVEAEAIAVAAVEELAEEPAPVVEEAAPAAIEVVAEVEAEVAVEVEAETESESEPVEAVLAGGVDTPQAAPVEPIEVTALADELAEAVAETAPEAAAEEEA